MLPTRCAEVYAFLVHCKMNQTYSCMVKAESYNRSPLYNTNEFSAGNLKGMSVFFYCQLKVNSYNSNLQTVANCEIGSLQTAS